MRRFFSFLSGLTALTHFPLGFWLVVRLGADGAALAVLIVTTTLALLRGRINLLISDRPISETRRRLLELPFFVHWCASVFAFLSFLLVMIGWAAFGITLERAANLSLYCYLGGLAVCGWSVLIRPEWVSVRTVRIELDGLPKEFDGYRLAQVSDVHVGSMFSPAKAKRLVSQVNQLNVDLIAFTGDYVTSGTAFHSAIAEVLAQMKARDGSIAVMGNHDYFGDGEPLVLALREKGIVVLRNERTRVTRGASALEIAGVEDTWTRRANVEETMRGWHQKAPMIVLAHDPNLFPKLRDFGPALVLSGHTHWGQIGVPFVAAQLNVAQLAYRYHAGLSVEGNATLYVNPGIGTTGPPFRFGVAPEITVLELRASSVEGSPSKLR